jgi:hypothetical protein
MSINSFSSLVSLAYSGELSLGRNDRSSLFNIAQSWKMDEDGGGTLPLA